MTRVPRLLHVFHSLGAGGAQTRFIRIANRFGTNLQHAVIALNGDYSILEQLHPGVQVEAIRLELKPHLFSRLAQYTALLEQISPHRLVTHNWGTIEWALGRRGAIRHLHIEDGFGPDELNGQKLRRVLFRRLALRHSEVVVPSQTLIRIARKIWKISDKKLHYIPNGIRLTEFDRPGLRAGKSPDNVAVIGTVAALRPEKNIARLLEAFALVKREINCELRIVGDGPERSKLEALAMKLGVGSSVVFCGFLADPRAEYDGFDVFALSSDTEQMPYTVLEAMASGSPIVATDVGDVKTIVSGENAALICAGSSTALAAAILRVLKNPQLAEMVSRSNRIKVEEEYNIERMYGAFAKLYGVPCPRPEFASSFA
jgi:glycosyltransferase involved in cell wall biosynthesis